jgi:hypothetical protein
MTKFTNKKSSTTYEIYPSLSRSKSWDTSFLDTTINPFYYDYETGSMDDVVYEIGTD